VHTEGTETRTAWPSAVAIWRRRTGLVSPGSGGWSRAPGPFEQLLEWAGSPTSATHIWARVDGTYHQNGPFTKIHGLILTGARLRKIHGLFTHLTIYGPLAELDHYVDASRASIPCMDLHKKMNRDPTRGDLTYDLKNRNIS
jgi:hypothetical protein